MKIILPIFIALFLFVLSLFGVFRNTYYTVKNSNSVKVSHTAKDNRLNRPVPVLAKEAAVSYSPPKQLVIPKIGLNANITSVGLDSQNRMDVPNNFVEVGWYNLGYMPGQKGSAVLDGHHDDFNGHPAVFYYLSDLEIGDQIYVTDQSGKQYTYKVTNNEIYPYDQLPLQQIFATNDKARLNIITCHGTWDSVRHDYSHRTVIYSELQV